MNWSIDVASFTEYIAKQLNSLFDDGFEVYPINIYDYFPETQKRVEKCFSKIDRKYFVLDGEPVFNHLHGDHYAMFLYLLSNTIYRKHGSSRLADKVFLLNKAMHGIDVYYKVELPEVFLFIHPVGTVLGHAKYGNYFCVYQNCTVGADGVTPGNAEFGEGVVLFSGCSVIGNCKIGKNVVLGANTFLLKTPIPKDSVVVGSYPNNRIFMNTVSVKKRIFNQ